MYKKLFLNKDTFLLPDSGDSSKQPNSYYSLFYLNLGRTRRFRTGRLADQKILFNFNLIQHFVPISPMFVYMYIILVQHLKSNKKSNINKRNQLAAVKLKIQLYFELYIVQFPVYCILYYNRYQHGTNCTGRRGRGGVRQLPCHAPPGHCTFCATPRVTAPEKILSIILVLRAEKEGRSIDQILENGSFL